MAISGGDKRNKKCEFEHKKFFVLRDRNLLLHTTMILGAFLRIHIEIHQP